MTSAENKFRRNTDPPIRYKKWQTYFGGLARHSRRRYPCKVPQRTIPRTWQVLNSILSWCELSSSCSASSLPGISWRLCHFLGFLEQRLYIIWFRPLWPMNLLIDSGSNSERGKLPGESWSISVLNEGLLLERHFNFIVFSRCTKLQRSRRVHIRNSENTMQLRN